MANVTPAGDNYQCQQRSFEDVFGKGYLDSYPSLTSGGQYPGGGNVFGTYATSGCYPSPWQYTPEHNPFNSPVPKPKVDIELVQKLLDRGLLHVYQLMQIVGDIQNKTDLELQNIYQNIGSIGTQLESKPIMKKDILEAVKLMQDSQFKSTIKPMFKLKDFITAKETYPKPKITTEPDETPSESPKSEWRRYYEKLQKDYFGY